MARPNLGGQQYSPELIAKAADGWNNAILTAFGAIQQKRENALDRANQMQMHQMALEVQMTIEKIRNKRATRNDALNTALKVFEMGRLSAKDLPPEQQAEISNQFILPATEMLTGVVNAFSQPGQSLMFENTKNIENAKGAKAKRSAAITEAMRRSQSNINVDMNFKETEKHTLKFLGIEGAQKEALAENGGEPSDSKEGESDYEVIGPISRAAQERKQSQESGTELAYRLAGIVPENVRTENARLGIDTGQQYKFFYEAGQRAGDVDASTRAISAANKARETAFKALEKLGPVVVTQLAKTQREQMRQMGKFLDFADRKGGGSSAQPRPFESIVLKGQLEVLKAQLNERSKRIGGEIDLRLQKERNLGVLGAQALQAQALAYTMASIRAGQLKQRAGEFIEEFQERIDKLSEAPSRVAELALAASRKAMGYDADTTLNATGDEDIPGVPPEKQANAKAALARIGVKIRGTQTIEVGNQIAGVDNPDGNVAIGLKWMKSVAPDLAEMQMASEGLDSKSPGFEAEKKRRTEEFGKLMTGQVAREASFPGAGSAPRDESGKRLATPTSIGDSDEPSEEEIRKATATVTEGELVLVVREASDDARLVRYANVRRSGKSMEDAFSELGAFAGRSRQLLEQFERDYKDALWSAAERKVKSARKVK